MNPAWYSQRFPPAGSISAEGIKKTLGKPPIPIAAILVREAAQNSWDARLGDRPVSFTLDLSIVPPQHVHAWRSLLLANAPYSDHFPLRQLLRGRDGQIPLIRILTVSDRGTKGLGGPTRADTPRGDEPRDWVSFVLNVGDPPDTKHGGGTYGYGKGVLYQISRAGTIIVHTRTRTATGLQSRLIGICLGESTELPDSDGTLRPYTGRHWWGDVHEMHVEPLVDAEAIAVAAALGLPQFHDDETGTDVVIVGPELGEENDEDAARYLADSVAWNLWPIMLEERGEARLVPAVRYDGRRITVPDPGRTVGLRTFVAAYRRLLEPAATGVEKLVCGNPRKELGRLALNRQLVATFDPPPAARDLGIDDTPHHVCLLRTPELVVRYHAGPTPISTHLAYAGVFRAFDEMDRVYAAAEPPTHDDWVSAQLEGNQRTFVKMTFTRLKERLTLFARPADVKTTGQLAPLGAASNFLGSIVGASAGSGAATSYFPGVFGGGNPGTPAAGTYGTAGAAPGRFDGGSAVAATGSTNSPPTDGVPDTAPMRPLPAGRVSAQLLGEPMFETYDGRLVLLQKVFVQGPGVINVHGVAGVMTADGTREAEPPSGGEQPSVVGWRSADGVTVGATIQVEDVDAGCELHMLVAPAADTVTHIDVDASLRFRGPYVG